MKTMFMIVVKCIHQTELEGIAVTGIKRNAEGVAASAADSQTKTINTTTKAMYILVGKGIH